MQEVRITVAKIPSLIRGDLRRTEERIFHAPVTVRQVIYDFETQLRSEGYSKFVVAKNGYIVDDLDELVKDGDFVCISVKHGVFLVGLIWVALWNAGLYTAINLTAYAIAGAIMIGAGILVTTFMNQPKSADQKQKNDSPSYGLAGANPTKAGYPIPVVFGNVAVTAPVIASYRTVDGVDYSIWQWILFAACVGPTNNAITTSDVMVGDEPLNELISYAFATTDGSLTPDPDQLDWFEYIWHDRAFDRNLACDYIFELDTLSSVDGVVVIVDFPNGLFKANDKGEIENLTVGFHMDYAPAGGAFTGAVLWEVTFNKTAAVRSSYTFTFPSNGMYTIRVKRITADDPESSSKQRSTSTLVAFQEAIVIKQIYPGIQTVAVGLKAGENLSGNIPKIEIIENVTSLLVQSWDGVSYMYVNPSNPAWAAYIALIDGYTGRKISPLQIVQTAWTEWIIWCDALVAGNKRAQCNIVFDEKGNFGDNCLAYIEDVGRAKVLQYGDLWTVVVDKPRTTPSYTFSSGNICKDSFSWESYEDHEKVDGVEIVYRDKDWKFKERRVLAKASWYESLTTQPNIASIELRGCNNGDQAQREAIFRMQKTEMVTRHGSLEVLPQGIFVERGDLVDIIHPTNRYGFSGRMSRDHSNATTIYLDQYIYMATADFSGKAYLYAIDKDGTRYELGVTGPFDTNTQTVTVDAPYNGDMLDCFAIGRPNQEKLKYQIINRKINPATEERTERIYFEFCEYVDEMYYHDSYESGTVAI